MNIFVTLVVLTMTRNFIMAETKQPIRDTYPKSTIKTPEKKSVTSSPMVPAHVTPANTVWKYKPNSQYMEQITNISQSIVVKPSISLTRIAKSFSYGFDPYFKKGYFEPFEKRPKPITLVAFRKNGLVLRENLKAKKDKPSDPAELQSPFNDIGSFWQDEVGQS